MLPHRRKDKFIFHIKKYIPLKISSVINTQVASYLHSPPHTHTLSRVRARAHTRCTNSSTSSWQRLISLLFRKSNIICLSLIYVTPALIAVTCESSWRLSQIPANKENVVLPSSIRIGQSRRISARNLRVCILRP